MKQFGSATCPNCQTFYDSLPVEGDEDGDCYVVLPMESCYACAALLCPNCPQFECDGCGEPFCDAHMVAVPDGTPKPLQCCAVCAAECEQLQLELPDLVPAASGTLPFVVKKGAA